MVLAPEHLAKVCSGWRRGDTDDFSWYRRISWLGTCLGTDPKASRPVLHSSYSVMWLQMIFKIKLALAVRFTRLENGAVKHHEQFSCSAEGGNKLLCKKTRKKNIYKKIPQDS